MGRGNGRGSNIRGRTIRLGEVIFVLTVAQPAAATISSREGATIATIAATAGVGFDRVNSTQGAAVREDGSPATIGVGTTDSNLGVIDAMPCLVQAFILRFYCMIAHNYFIPLIIWTVVCLEGVGCFDFHCIIVAVLFCCC
jgi:hypothetical protein